MNSNCVVFVLENSASETFVCLIFLLKTPILFPFLTVLATDGNNQLTKTCSYKKRTPKIDIHSMKSTSG